MLRIITKDMHAYDDFLRDKMLGSAVSDVQSRIVITRAKRTTAAPLELISAHIES
jgi:hypothetical protein